MLYLKLGTHAGTLDKIALTLGLLAGFLFGGWHELLTALLILQGLDIFTGLLVGGKDKNISSSVMNAGIKKKNWYMDCYYFSSCNRYCLI
ncbi:phage holin family protein [Carnobacterium jeotgali]|uniref:phage holin family protein n=1 Tax=Carnobacterium jeotgali TaxID=545534 RepID=UPI0009DF268D|nr:phage holin family protein [Carnobacterium jeotgali]